MRLILFLSSNFFFTFLTIRIQICSFFFGWGEVFMTQLLDSKKLETKSLATLEYTLIYSVLTADSFLKSKTLKNRTHIVVVDSWGNK